MRKFVKPLLCGMMVAALMAGCSKKENPVTSESPTETSEEASSSVGEESPVPVDLGEVTSLGEYKGLKVDRMSTEVTDEELNTRIQSILDANPEYVAITDRAAKEGDIVDIDYVGMKDGFYGNH